MNVSDAYVGILESDAANAEIMNVGSSNYITIRQFAENEIGKTDADVDNVHDDPRD